MKHLSTREAQREIALNDNGDIIKTAFLNLYGPTESVSREFKKNFQNSLERCFPKDTIQGLARNFADVYSRYLEIPWSFLVNAYLTCLGSVISNRLTLNSEIKPQPRMFTMILGESAFERKSEAEKQVVDHFIDALPSDFFPCYGVGSAEGLAQRFKEHPKTLLVYDEAKVFVSKAVIESSVLLPCVNTLFEGNRFHSHTKNHSIQVDNGHLSILAASTIDTFRRMWTSAFTDIGFINRLWLVPDSSERKFSIPQSIPEREKTSLKEELVCLFNALPTELTFLSLAPEAFQIFDDWYNNTPRTIFTKRLDTYGHRLMILFCANENKTKVTGGIAERVVRLLQWQQKVREEYDVLDAENLMAKTEIAIRKALMRGPLQRRELQKRTHYERVGIFIWDMALKNLSKEEVFYDHKNKVYQLRSDE